MENHTSWEFKVVQQLCVAVSIIFKVEGSTSTRREHSSSPEPVDQMVLSELVKIRDQLKVRILQLDTAAVFLIYKKKYMQLHFVGLAVQKNDSNTVCRM